MKFFLTCLIVGIIIFPLSAQKSTLGKNEVDANSRGEFNFSCNLFEIHPVEGDFTSDIGKIMISTEHDDVYYTDYQNEDAEVTISVVMDVVEAGTTVFFRVIDPDDLSSYETDNAMNDNEDMDIGEGKLNGMTGVVSILTEESTSNPDISIAEVTLKITDRYAGDNYQVQASLNEDFDTNISETINTVTLTAWKRIYVEIDRMYKKGTTVLSNTGVGDNNNSSDDIVIVEDVSDFIVGSEVEIFAPPSFSQTPIETTVLAINNQTKELTLNDEGDYNFPSLSGIKLKNNNEVFDVSQEFMTDGYGEFADGSDGGVFTEFKEISVFEGSGFIPKFTKFTTFSAVNNLISFYKTPACDPLGGGVNCENYVQIAFARDFEDSNGNPSRGLTSSLVNLTILFLDNIENDPDIENIQAGASEVLVHEIGHQFDLFMGDFDIVDLDVSTPLNHEESDVGIMSSGRDPDDNEAEFSMDVLLHIRSLLDGI